jgi:hypothetical protein
MGDDFYGNYQREYTKCFNGLLSTRVLGPYAVTLTMEQILHFDFKGPPKSVFTARWLPALDDHCLIRFKRFEKGAVAKNLSTVGLELRSRAVLPGPCGQPFSWW